MAVPVDAAHAAAVQVHVVWRRRPIPAVNYTCVIAALPPSAADAAAELLPNVTATSIDSHAATILFEPRGASVVHLYYMPYTFSGGSGGYSIKFSAVPPQPAHPDWLAAHGAGAGVTARHTATPTATVTGFAARTDFDKFIATEHAASADETAAFMRAAGDPPFAVFAEKRQRPIRMDTTLPISWLSGAGSGSISDVRLEDAVQPSEYYVWQLGVVASRQPVIIESWSVDDKHLESAVSCFNLGEPSRYRWHLGCILLKMPAISLRAGGRHYNGTAFSQPMRVNASHVGALWFGIDTDVAGADTQLNFSVTISVNASGVRKQASVSVALTVAGSPIASKGDRDPWRLARLRWLDSEVGSDYNVSRGYEPMSLSSAATGGGDAASSFELSLLNRKLTIDSTTGLPTSISSNGRELLAGPIGFEARAAAGSTR